MDVLLNSEITIDVSLFEEAARAVVQGGQHMDEAHRVMQGLKEQPDAYLRMDAVLQNSVVPEAHFFALQILESCIESRWNLIDNESRLGIRNFLIGLLVEWSANQENMRNNKMVMTKLNTCVVAILKREWPSQWPEFMTDLMASCDYSPGMLENNLRLLALLGEEVFIYGEKTMTSVWLERKKTALSSDIELVFRLCIQAFGNEDTLIVNTAIETLEKYIASVSLEHVFMPELFDFLVNYALGNDQSLIPSLRCLAEIAAIKIPVAAPERESYFSYLREMFTCAMEQVMNRLPTTHNDVEQQIQAFCEEDPLAVDVVDSFGQFLVAFLRNHLPIVKHMPEAVICAHSCLLGITYIPHNKELFKMCVDYWWFLGDVLVRETTHGSSRMKRASGVRHASSGPRTTRMDAVLEALGETLTNVRFALVKHMAKPEEIIIVEDENGDLQHQEMTDVESLQLYNQMRQALVFLTNLDPHSTIQIILHLTEKQVDRSEWSWNNLNTLCWAVGSIAGVLDFNNEKDLFVDVIKMLLDMCREMEGKPNKAVIASDIMYVTGQFPRFLESHPRFLRTVTTKLFEFMQEPFPGVMDMAVDTFLKVCKGVPGVFHAVVQETGQPFVVDIINNIQETTKMLSYQQLQTFYEGMGALVAVAQDGNMLSQLMSEANAQLKGMAELAATNFTAILNSEDLRTLIMLLRLNIAVAKNAGAIMIEQIQFIFDDIEGFYRNLGAAVAQEIGNNERAAQHQNVKYMRTAKREIMRLIEEFVKHTTHRQFVSEACMPLVLSFVLQDYHDSPHIAKEPACLALIAACVRKLQDHVLGSTKDIIDATFQCTLDLIVSNMADFPEHRVNLFKLLDALTNNCFSAVLESCASNPDVFKGVLWSIQHTDNAVMSVGLDLLYSFLNSVLESPERDGFFDMYMADIINDLVVSMTDTMHASGMQQQCEILRLLFRSTQPHDGQGEKLSSQFLGSQVVDILQNTFPALQASQVHEFVENCFSQAQDMHSFRVLIGDLLIESQVWGAEQETQEANMALRVERESFIPGFSRMTGSSTNAADRLSNDLDGVLV